MSRTHRIDPQAPPRPSSLLRRTAGGLIKVAGLAIAILGVGLVFVHWVLTVLGVVAGIALTIVGDRLSPSAGTGAFTARYTMETGGWGDLHYVKPPGGNVSDPLPGREGRRFTGR